MYRNISSLILAIAVMIMPSSLMSETVPPSVEINNRIIAKANGKAISLMDVVKKMDVIFYREFPQYADIIEARYQFYTTNWKHVLDDIINHELIMADAKAKKVTLTDGDVNEEMEEMFGPNVIETVEKLGMTYREAWEILKGEITLQRIMGYFVNHRAMAKITPQSIRNASEKYCSENTTQEIWTYRVLSIRDDNTEIRHNLANIAYNILTNDKVSLDNIIDELNNKNMIDATSSVTVSGNNKHSVETISEQYKEILLSLPENSYSIPVEHTSRGNNAPVYRIFFLKNYKPSKTPTFHDVEDIVKNNLFHEYAAEETIHYITSIRKQFNINDDSISAMIPEYFEPFALHI